MLTKTVVLVAFGAAVWGTAGVAQAVYPRVADVVYTAPKAAPASGADRIVRDCTQLELSAGVTTDACGTLPLTMVAKLKADADSAGTENE